MLSPNFKPVLLPQASFVNFLDTTEKNARFGVEFFRSFTGLVTDGEIREITQSDLDPILRVNLSRLCAAMCERSGEASKVARKNLNATMTQAFPQLRGVGCTFREDASAKPSKTWDGCPNVPFVESYGTKDGSKYRSCVISWKYSNKVGDSILDPTVILPVYHPEHDPAQDGHDGTQPKDAEKRDKSSEKYSVAWVEGEVSRVNSMAIDKTSAWYERINAGLIMTREHQEIIAMYRLGLLTRKPYAASPWEVSEDILPAYSYAMRDSSLEATLKTTSARKTTATRKTTA